MLLLFVCADVAVHVYLCVVSVLLAVLRVSVPVFAAVCGCCGCLLLVLL